MLTYSEGWFDNSISAINWVQADHTIHLETDGVEVQVQPRADVSPLKQEKTLSYWVQSPEEDAGAKVGENATLKAGRNITLNSGLKDEGEGDTEVKEETTLIAGDNITIASGLSGVTKIKEESILTAGGDIIIESGDAGETIRMENYCSSGRNHKISDI